MVKKQEKAIFKPNKKQLEYATMILDLDLRLTKTDIAKKIGVNYTTVWRWEKDENFVNWINNLAEKTLKFSYKDRLLSAIRKAKNGNFPFSKLLFEMEGKYIQKTESTITNIYDGYENMTDDEIIEEFKRDLERFTNKQAGMDRKVNKVKKD